MPVGSGGTAGSSLLGVGSKPALLGSVAHGVWNAELTQALTTLQWIVAAKLAS